MLIALMSTFALAIVSALCPLVNIETYLMLAAAMVAKFGVWPMSVAAASGQALGKLCWYAIGRSSMKCGFIARKMEKPRWKAKYEKLASLVEQRTVALRGTLFLAATVGLPPLAIMSVVSGQLHVSAWSFYLTTFVGRTLRFAAVMGGISWIASKSLGP